jgi:type I restriction enzyme S subunit
MEGEESTIGALIAETGGSIKTGPFGTRLKASEYTSTGVPVISVGEVGDGRLRVHLKTPRVDETVTSRMPEYLLRAGDIVFGRKGAVERSAQVQPDEDGYFLGSDGIRLRLNPYTCDPKFIAYQLQTQVHKNWMIQHAAGTTMPSLNEGIIRNIPIVLKPLNEQKRIAHILGALDDKIALNQRMNATLEAMARALFQSWFVDFDPVRAKMDGRKPEGMDEATAALFPIHFEKGSDGNVPEGWRYTTLGEVIHILDSKRIPLSGRERQARQGKYPYHGAAAVMDHVDDFLFDGIYALIGEDGSVINDDGTPVVQYVWGKFWVNNHAHVLCGKNSVSTEHLLLHLKGSNITPFVNGAVQLKLNQGNMKRIPFLLPPAGVGQAFTKIVEPFFAQIRRNSGDSHSLAAMRDSMFPALLNEATGKRRANLFTGAEPI